ncbi:MAG: class II aldolase/adducin family protein [Gammaproteobacteria bacterium]|nr:class II aldolase/adducin family protein [Gammaproteobacteria bacterium]
MTSPFQQTLEELFAANRILSGEGVIDGFGHVSVRSPIKPDHYFMTRSNAGGPVDESNVVELDAQSNVVRPIEVRPSIERFIHGEIYLARPDVMAVVHTHAPALIPFGVSAAPLRPLYHMCGFLDAGAPVFDIRKKHGMTNLLIVRPDLGQDLAATLGNSAVVLMRGHGATIVGSSLKEVVFRAVYTLINAQLQPIAMQLGTPTYLAPEEAKLADELHHAVLNRPWEYWLEKHT